MLKNLYLKTCLKKKLKLINRFFNYVESFIVTKVDVTVVIINKNFLILIINYNNLNKININCDK